MASQCLSLAAETTDEQHKSVLLRAAAKLNELADGQASIIRHRRSSASPDTNIKAQVAPEDRHYTSPAKPLA